MNLNEIIVDYLKESGLDVDEWKLTISSDNPKYRLRERWHRYSVVPGLAFLQIVQNESETSITLRGVLPEHRWAFDVEDPDCFPSLERRIRELYIWVQKISSDSLEPV